MPSKPPSSHAAAAAVPRALDPRLRLLLIDADEQRRAVSSAAVERAGASEPATAHAGDDALDVLGAAAQRFDVVAAWMPLPDDEDVDMVGVLRRCRSPVRLLVVTDLHPVSYPRPGRLAGASAVLDGSSHRSLPSAIREVLEHGASFEQIVLTRTVPDSMARRWSEPVYGSGPGLRFHAPLD